MKSVRTIVIAVAVIGVGIGAINICYDREPRYAGRRLSQWVKQGQSTLNEKDPEWLAAASAVQGLGTNSIPFLLKLASARDSKLEKRIDAWLEKLEPYSHFRLRLAAESRERAYVGFALLGEKARGAWPVFIKWTSAADPELRLRGLAYLAWTNPDKETYLPVLLRLTKDPDKNIRSPASDLFRARYPREAEAAGIYKPIPPVENQPTTKAST